MTQSHNIGKMEDELKTCKQLTSRVHKKIKFIS